MGIPSMNLVSVVQRQLEAYNERDLERFVAAYSDTVQIFRPPVLQPAISGMAQLSEFYRTQRFNLPALKAEILNRMVLGSRVIDHERIWGVRDKPFEVAVVYEVVDDKIQTVWAFAAE